MSRGNYECRFQVSTECRERATLLAAVWAHSSALVELRCTLASRHALAHQEAVSGALREEAFAAASVVKYATRPETGVNPARSYVCLAYSSDSAQGVYGG
jgi:hypothetical protein